MPLSLRVNGRDLDVLDFDLNAEPDTPLLWILRDHLALTGTKFGCGTAHCGACTVQVNGRAVRSCVTPVAKVVGKDITTIEGLTPENGDWNPVAKEWVAQQVPQCGYCQCGQIMAATALISARKDKWLAESDARKRGEQVDEDIDTLMAGNLCRCGTYPRIRQAIKNIAGLGGDE